MVPTATADRGDGCFQGVDVACGVQQAVSFVLDDLGETSDIWSDHGAASSTGFQYYQWRVFGPDAAQYQCACGREFVGHCFRRQGRVDPFAWKGCHVFRFSGGADDLKGGNRRVFLACGFNGFGDQVGPFVWSQTPEKHEGSLLSALGGRRRAVGKVLYVTKSLGLSLLGQPTRGGEEHVEP